MGIAMNQEFPNWNEPRVFVNFFQFHAFREGFVFDVNDLLFAGNHHGGKTIEFDLVYAGQDKFFHGKFPLGRLYTGYMWNPIIIKALLLA